MITSWDIYWITRLENFGIAMFVIAGALIVASIFLGMESSGKKAWKCFVVGLVLLFMASFLPSTKEAIAIWALPKIANNEKVQQIPENFANLIDKKLKEWMSDIEILPKKD